VINKKAVNIIYIPLSSGSEARDIVPHSITDNGLRWHIRAFGRKIQSFRDFVLTRISKVTIKNSEVIECESKLEELQWMRMMLLELVPQPKNIQHPTALWHG